MCQFPTRQTGNDRQPWSIRQFCRTGVDSQLTTYQPGIAGKTRQFQRCPHFLSILQRQIQRIRRRGCSLIRSGRFVGGFAQGFRQLDGDTAQIRVQVQGEAWRMIARLAAAGGRRQYRLPKRSYR